MKVSNILTDEPKYVEMKAQFATQGVLYKTKFGNIVLAVRHPEHDQTFWLILNTFRGVPFLSGEETVLAVRKLEHPITLENE